jgi:hypothetical protein
MSTSDRTVVAQIRKNANETIVVSLDRFNGHELIDIRAWSIFGEPAEFRPMKKGVSLKIELLPELIEALTSAQRVVRERDLLVS